MKDLHKKFRIPDSLWYRLPKPRGNLGIKLLGYGGYVGGLWEEAGAAQFEFLCSQGLKPHHYLLDIACGSLRGGTKFIPFLDAGHYMGVDQEEMLIQLGVEKELGPKLYTEKKPQLLVSDSFEFDKLDHSPHYALAISLFTHLPESMILDCLIKLRRTIRNDGIFFASYSETDRPRRNPVKAHPHRGFQYTRQQMLDFGQQAGWQGEMSLYLSLGAGQQLIKYSPR
jgi:hypothetical protein